VLPHSCAMGLRMNGAPAHRGELRLGRLRFVLSRVSEVGPGAPNIVLHVEVFAENKRATRLSCPSWFPRI